MFAISFDAICSRCGKRFGDHYCLGDLFACANPDGSSPKPFGVNGYFSEVEAMPITLRSPSNFPKEDEPDWKLLRDSSVQNNECVCGINKKQCEYHRNS